MLQHALQQHRLRQQAGVEQPAFPAVLVTGDWNMQKMEWRAHFQSRLPDHVRINIQIVESTVKRPNHHGDVTVAINCDAFRKEAPAWTTFSDAHRVVIAPVRLLAAQSITLLCGYSRAR